MKTSHLNNGVVELPVLCWAETVHLCSTIRSELKLYTSETFYVDLHRTVQLLLIYSCLWLSMAVYSCLWILMTNYDQLWQNGRFADAPRFPNKASTIRYDTLRKTTMANMLAAASSF